MATYVKFEQFVEDLSSGLHQLHAAGHTLNIFLTNAAPNAATHETKGSGGGSELDGITEENGYAVTDIQNDISRSGGILSVTTVAQIVFTATGAGFGPFRYVVVYNDTQTSPADPLVCYWDYGSEVPALSVDETFTVDFGTELFTLT